MHSGVRAVVFVSPALLGCYWRVNWPIKKKPRDLVQHTLRHNTPR